MVPSFKIKKSLGNWALTPSGDRNLATQQANYLKTGVIRVTKGKKVFQNKGKTEKTKTLSLLTKVP
jgi:hypothetical protein